MRIAVAILLGYMTTGVFFVWRDLSARKSIETVGAVLNYRSGGSFLWLLFAGLTWFPTTLLAMYWRRGPSMKREITTLALFLFAAFIFGIISN